MLFFVSSIATLVKSKIPTCLMSLMFSLLSFSYILNGVFQSYNNKYTNQTLRRINKVIF